MKRRILAAGIILPTIGLAAALYLKNHSIAVLQPRGQIAGAERDLILLAAVLSLIVVVPVFIMLFLFAWRYREQASPKTPYTPNWDHHTGLESAWWAIPAAIIVVLSAVTWESSHRLDPFKPIASTTKSEVIQVVALQWKWLFIYPEQGVASVNKVFMPVGRPVSFQITSDAPMNSFWIPSLGGQTYAMAGMDTQLHLQADEPGTYRGVSANISGDGFASMHFSAIAESPQQYNDRLAAMARDGDTLNEGRYELLAKPGILKGTASYAHVTPGLYDAIMMKYMSPSLPGLPAYAGGHL